jgi:hypothetical protein
MSKSYSWLLVVCLLIVPCLVHADSLVNPGFETGDLTGWSYDNSAGGSDWADVFTSWDGQTIDYTPAFGSNFLVMRGWLWSDVYQDVYLYAGQVLNGMAALDNASESGSTSAILARVRIIEGGGGATLANPWTKTATDVAFTTSGNWETWSWTAPYSGTFRLNYNIYAVEENSNEFALFDAQPGDAPAPVPEPGTLVLMLMGLPGGAMWWRRRKKA